MSIKTKLSVAISLIVLVVVILYHILSEYSMLQGMQELMRQTMRDTSIHVAESFAYYEKQLDTRPEDGTSGPEHVFDIVKKVNPAIKEITVFEIENALTPYGTYTYLDAINDNKFVQAVKSEEFALREVAIDGGQYYRSYYTDENMGKYVISIVYDKVGMKNLVVMKRDYTIMYFSLFLLLVLIVNYWLVDVMIRPLKDILWKVNEVSSVRFHKPIQIKSKDEFGLLALKINAMSQNLSIYMNKLRKAFEENRRMKEHLESFINHSNDAIHLIDLEGRVIQVNRAFEQLFEYAESDLLGQRHPTVPATHQRENRQMINQLLAGKTLPAQETLRQTKSGEKIPVSITVSPIRNSDGTIQAIASICRDMRSRNKMEELLRRSEKLTTVGQLAAGVAHEIRNPLTTLRGFLQLQQQSNTLKLAHVNIMLSELDRINLIVGEFLILAKPQATKFITKDVRDVLHDVLLFLDSEAHLHNIVFQTMYTDEQCLISCEENQLKQVFINLLKNAIESMPGGGNVHISMSKKKNNISIFITDEGVGIPEDMISKIGDPFFTGKETGTGLGLMVSQRIINGHQGTLDIQSKVNVGTTVRLTLPALKEDNASVILEA